MYRFWLPSIAVLIGLSLLIMGYISLQTAYPLERHRKLIDALKNQQPVAMATLLEANQELTESVSKYSSPSLLRSLAVVQLQLSRQVPEPKEQKQLRAAAIDHLKRALAQAPADPLLWTRLAWARHLHGESEQALEALRFSTLLAAHAPEQMWWRLELWFRLIPQITHDDHSMLRRQLVFALETDSASLVNISRRYQRLVWLVQQLSLAGISSKELGELVQKARDQIMTGSR